MKHKNYFINFGSDTCLNNVLRWQALCEDYVLKNIN